MQQQLATPEMDPIPESIDSPQAQLVYLYLEAVDGTANDDLSEQQLQQQLATVDLGPIPDQVTSPQTQLVYLYLQAVGGTTIDNLSKTLELKTVATLHVLDSLRAESLIETDGDTVVVA